MTDLVGHFVRLGPDLDHILSAACCAFGTPAVLRDRRREADKLIRDVEQYRKRLDEVDGWPLPPEGANYFIPRPGRKWEAGRNARDAAEWQLALRSGIDDLIALHKETLESCYRLAPSPLTSTDEAACQKYNEESQRALEVYHAWLKDRAELETRLCQFRNDMSSFQYPAPGDQSGADQGKGAGAAGASDQGKTEQAEGNAAGRAGDQGRAEPAEEVGGTKTDGGRDELIHGMKRSVRLAYLTFTYAESKAEKRLEDAEAYALLKEKGIPGDAGECGELTGYSLPPFVTWARQLREARKALGEQKYTRRSGRTLGKGIVKADCVENQQGRNQ
jgi:hypothetical protein